jgi:hypothetical protein
VDTGIDWPVATRVQVASRAAMPQSEVSKHGPFGGPTTYANMEGQIWQLSLFTFVTREWSMPRWDNPSFDIVDLFYSIIRQQTNIIFFSLTLSNFSQI